MSYIFIGGSQRSGTTLLTQILGQDTSANPALAECAYFRSLLQAYSATRRERADEIPFYFDSQEHFRQFHRQILKQFLEHTQKRYAPAEHLVLKEPHLTLFFPELYQLFPEAKLIMMMRDPRDTLASMYKVRQRIEKSGASHPLTQMSLAQMVQHYLDFYVPTFTSQDAAYKEHCPFIRYEDLVSAPENLIETLRKLTGLPLDNFDWKQPMTRIHPLKEQGNQRVSPWRTELRHQPLSAQNIGQYKALFKTEEIRLIESHPGVRAIFDMFAYQAESY